MTAHYPHLPAGGAPAGSIVVRIVESGGEPRAIVRQVERQTEYGDVHPTEEAAVEDALRLANSRLKNQKQAEDIYIDMEPGIEWKEEWGRLD
jgi:hypothetical protein